MKSKLCSSDIADLPSCCRIYGRWASARCTVSPVANCNCQIRSDAHFSKMTCTAHRCQCSARGDALVHVSLSLARIFANNGARFGANMLPWRRRDGWDAVFKRRAMKSVIIRPTVIIGRWRRANFVHRSIIIYALKHKNIVQ